jgi:hypothetical protein
MMYRFYGQKGNCTVIELYQHRGQTSIKKQLHNRGLTPIKKHFAGRAGVLAFCRLIAASPATNSVRGKALQKWGQTSIEKQLHNPGLTPIKKHCRSGCLLQAGAISVCGTGT